MRRLLTVVGTALLVALLASCGLGYLATEGTGRAVVTVLRDLSLILFAIYTLVGALVAAAIFGGGAWALDRFGSKGVAGLAWARIKVRLAEDKALAALESGVVRPMAKTTEAVTAARTFVTAAVPGEAADRPRYPVPVIRVVTSIVRQLRRSPAHPEREGVPGA